MQENIDSRGAINGLNFEVLIWGLLHFSRRLKRKLYETPGAAPQ
jgi:hypothetical protein